MCFNLHEYLTPGVINKFRPYRNVFIIISIIAIFFAVLIIVENIIFLSIASKQSPLLLLLPYLLSWILIFLGCCFARFAYLLHTRQFKRFSSVTPLSSISWMNDSRPVSPALQSPSIRDDFTPSPNVLHQRSLNVPIRETRLLSTNPFFISDTVITYPDEPPSYSEIVDRGVSPVPGGMVSQISSKTSPTFDH